MGAKLTEAAYFYPQAGFLFLLTVLDAGFIFLILECYFVTRIAMFTLYRVKNTIMQNQKTIHEY
jgi:hypothetical protein